MEWIILFTADPAPLVFALSAGHVVAAWYFLDSDFASGAVAHILRGGPQFEIFIHGVLTFHFAMPFPPAVKTDLLAAGAGDESLLLFFDEVVAVGSGAPFQIGIQVNVYVLFKSEIFIEDLLGPEPPNIVSREFFGTIVLCTLNFKHLPICDIEF